MMEINQITNLVEQYVKQLESLKYSKNSSMAVRLSGAIDCGILISGLSADQWSRRVTLALNEIMANQPSAQSLPSNLPDTLAKAVTLPPPVQQQQQASANVVPLPKI
jgi:hypothetical protein